MQRLQHFILKLSSKQVGCDQHGNKYYESKYKDFFGRKRRYMIYNGIAEPSKAPAEWYSWLHHLRMDTPTQDDKLDWQQERLPNLTGTKHAYHPLKTEGHAEVSADYKSWKPN